jgi:acyl carrier protein
MDRSAISTIVRDEVAAVCRIPPDQIEPSTELFSLGIDSISIVQLVGRLSRRFNTGLRVRDFFVSPCVDGIVDMLESQLNESHE